MTATATRSRPTRLSVPPLYRDVVADKSARIAIEHARLECRITETMVATALRDVAGGETVVIFAANPVRAKWLAAKWLDAIAPGTKRFTATQGGLSAWSWETRSGGALWLVGGSGIRKEALPFTSAARLFILAAHEVGVDLPAMFAGVPCVAAGELADRDHWFYRFARAEGASLHRFTAAAIVAAFPDQATNVPPPSDPARARQFDLRDVDESSTIAPFSVFARKRLMIVTDDRHWLTPLQQMHAETQFGEPMVPLDLQAVQKAYLARKRLAVRQGRKPWFLLLKYRRGGFTTVEQALHRQTMVTRPRSRVMTLADTRAKTAEIFRTSLLFDAEDPQRPARINDATTSIELANGSVATIGTAGAHATARGLMLSRFHGCLVAGTPVLLEDGREVPIEDVEPGRRVLTHMGNVATVVGVVQKDVALVPGSGETVVVHPWMGRPIELTPDHKVWTKRGWVEAAQLTLSDEVSMPVRGITADVAELDLAAAADRPQGGGKQRHGAGTKLVLTESLGFFIGYYLAEGSLIFNDGRHPSAVLLTRHRDEGAYAERAYQAVSACVTSRHIDDRKDSLTTTETLYGAALAEMIDREFGHRHAKVVPDWVWRAGEAFCRGLLAGYLSGDGSKSPERAQGYSCPRVRATSIRSSLTYQMRDLAASLGLGWGSVAFRSWWERNGDDDRNTKDAWTVSWTGRAARRIRALICLDETEDDAGRAWIEKATLQDGHAWMRIRSIHQSRVADVVYDLQVDHPDHSFRTGSFAVSNSEAAFWCLGPNQHRDVGNLMAGVMGAARYGEIVLETTPNGQEWFFTKWQEAKDGLNAFTPIFLPWFVDPRNRLDNGQFNVDEIRDTLNADEQRLIKKHGLNPNQIAFRRKMKREHGVLFAQEFPEDDITCFLSTGTCYFNAELLRTLLGDLEDNGGKVKHLAGGREIRWKEPVKGRRYVAGADTSEGLEGCDPNGIAVLDFATGEQVCDVHGRFNPRTLAEHIKRVCTDYNGALVGVERENHGHAVLQKLEDLGFNRPHFRGGPLFHFHQGDSVDQWRAGWSTNAETRPVMLAELSAAIEESAFKVNDRELVQECLAFKLQSNGKFEADPAAHDDRVIKAAIAWQMRKHYRPVGAITWT